MNPLNVITEETRAALEAELETPVFAGMKHWTPRIADAAERAVGPVRRPSSGSCSRRTTRAGSIAGYRHQLENGRSMAGQSSCSSRAGTTTPASLGCLPSAFGRRKLTSCSRPTRSLRECSREEIPMRTSSSRPRSLVAEAAGVADWSFSYQSESPTGEPWLQPGHPRPPRDAAPRGSELRPRVSGRLRLRPPRDPLGPRRRGGRARCRARSGVRPDRHAERRSSVRGRARGRRSPEGRATVFAVTDVRPARSGSRAPAAASACTPSPCAR